MEVSPERIIKKFSMSLPERDAFESSRSEALNCPPNIQWPMIGGGGPVAEST